MKSILKILFLTSCFYACNTKIKDAKTKVIIEKGTEFDLKSKKEELQQTTGNQNPQGYWVGYFEKDDSYNNNTDLHVDEGFYWTRENKINLSIDSISEDKVLGHTVVAGNNRPFMGTVKDGVFQVKEPGNDRYDGEFRFSIDNNVLKGKWKAKNNIEIKNRKFELIKMFYSYNPNLPLEKSRKYVEWNTFTKTKYKENLENGEFEAWIKKEFATSTNLIYTLNASNTLLKKQDVENLKKGDIAIIRNTIYARHGYSFKNRTLRIFFDAQSWYIPLHSDIKSNFTDIEKQNIKLLLLYEKNALEYYDYFGRG